MFDKYLIMMTKMLIHTTHFYRILSTNRFSTVLLNINRYPIGISLMVTKCLLLCPLSSDSKLRPLFPPPQIKYCTLYIYIHTTKSRFRPSQTATAVTLIICTDTLCLAKLLLSLNMSSEQT